MKTKPQQTERQRLAKADIECPLCNQNRSSEGYGDWICSPCYNKLLGDLRKEGRLSMKSEFERDLLTKDNHILGCMLECYVNVLEYRGFIKEAKQLEEIASKLK